MKKKIKAESEFLQFLKKGIKVTINDNLKPSPTTGNGLVARKLKMANEGLSQMKSLPKLSHEE
jgi:hypothetical protein